MKSKVFSTEEVKDVFMTFKKLVAEFLGTFILVFALCTSVTVNTGGMLDPKPEAVTLGAGKPDPAAVLTQVALTGGIALATLAASIGHVSGGHVNPAVTLGFLVTGQISIFMTILYWVVQLAGGIVGAAVVNAIVPAGLRGNLGSTVVNASVPVECALIMEAIATGIFLMVIQAVCDDRRKDFKGSAPLAIGLALSSLIMITGNITGASLNPARSLGPAVMSSTWDDHWIYWVGPFIGGSIGSMLYRFLFRPPESDEMCLE